MPVNTNKAVSRSTAGFTLFELIVAVGIVGILSAMVAPIWFSFVQRQSLNIAQNQIYRAMQEAKSNAKLQKVTWQFSIRKTDDVVQWAVHSTSVSPAKTQWNNLDKNIDLDAETTLQESGGVRKIEFNYQGNVTKSRLGRVTLSTRHGGKIKRCVFVSTLIGTLRTAKEHSQPNRKDGKYCY